MATLKRKRATFGKGGAPIGEGAHISTFPYKQARQTALKGFEVETNKLMRILSLDLRKALSKHLEDELIHIGYEILREAVTHCPYDTGQLRSSGKVDLFRGTSKHEVVETTADGTGAFEVIKTDEGHESTAKTLSIEISFEREERGIDIALWAHEQLLPYEPRPYYYYLPVRSPRQGRTWKARHPGTGPKYLEDAYRKFGGFSGKGFEQRLQRGIARGLRFICGRNKYLMEIGEL